MMVKKQITHPNILEVSTESFAVYDSQTVGDPILDIPLSRSSQRHLRRKKAKERKRIIDEEFIKFRKINDNTVSVKNKEYGALIKKILAYDENFMGSENSKEKENNQQLKNKKLKKHRKAQNESAIPNEVTNFYELRKSLENARAQRDFNTLRKICELQESLEHSTPPKVAELLAQSTTSDYLKKCDHHFSDTETGLNSDLNQVDTLLSNNCSKTNKMSSSDTKSNKSREEILSERKTKKSMKKAQQKSEQDTVTSEIQNVQITVPFDSASNENKTDSRKIVQERSHEEIIAEREAKKLAKKMKSAINKTNKTNDQATGNLVKEEIINKVVADNNLNIVKTMRSENKFENTPKMEKEVSVENKSKAELRAERRAKQEAQRAAKAATLTEKTKTEQTKQNKLENDPVRPKEVTKTDKIVKPKIVPLQNRVHLFSHLYLEKEEVDIIDGSQLHPAIHRLGKQYASKIIVGSNARCIALLNAIKEMVRTYKTPPNQEFGRSLECELQKVTKYLQHCRPMSVSMTNALRHLKRYVTSLPNNIVNEDAAKKVNSEIDKYITEEIDMADQAISEKVQSKISSNDVILTYGCSSLIKRILLDAHKSNKKFRVIVVDGKPWLEGREMIRRLTAEGLRCTYVLISAASLVMAEANLVLLGVHSLLANGYVMSRAGTAQVALMASSFNVPVLVCCETYKFCERVQTDSFVYNEIGEQSELEIAKPKDEETAENNKNTVSVTPLNLTYDVTPPDLVTAVVTELAILPCTSVPVILRIKPNEIGC